MLRLLTAGESHGRALVAIVEGLPAGLPITEDEIRGELRRIAYLPGDCPAGFLEVLLAHHFRPGRERRLGFCRSVTSDTLFQVLQGLFEVISHFRRLALEPVCHTFQYPGKLLVEFPLHRMYGIG